jgi:hypothetical protein
MPCLRIGLSVLPPLYRGHGGARRAGPCFDARPECVLIPISLNPSNQVSNTVSSPPVLPYFLVSLQCLRADSFGTAAALILVSFAPASADQVDPEEAAAKAIGGGMFDEVGWTEGED